MRDVADFCHLNTLHQRPARDFIAQLAGIYLCARPLTRESYDRYMLLRKPSLLLERVTQVT